MVESFEMESPLLGNGPRRIFVYRHDEERLRCDGSTGTGGRGRPLLIMQDGQNLFTGTCNEVPWQWRLDETAGGMISDGRLPDLVIAGVANSRNRDVEYTHGRCAFFKRGGGAGRYLDFLSDELIPLMSERYGTSRDRRDIGIGGSSLGGLLVLYAAFTRGDVFSRFIAMSPSIWWDDFSIFELMARRLPLRAGTRLWVDIGRLEAKGVFVDGRLFRPLRAYRYLRDFLELAFIGRRNSFRYREDRLGRHDERYWGRRMKAALAFVFGISGPDRDEMV